nr:MAG TPA: Helix-turn-helix XRE-family like protein [Caudoviricetes sp.]
MSFAAARKKAGLNQVDAAKVLGVTQGAISMWENGRTKPRSTQIVEIAKLYGVTVDELLKEDEE